jgi:hypothetical protein
MGDDDVRNAAAVVWNCGNAIHIGACGKSRSRFSALLEV